MQINTANAEGFGLVGSLFALRYDLSAWLLYGFQIRYPDKKYGTRIRYLRRARKLSPAAVPPYYNLTALRKGKDWSVEIQWHVMKEEAKDSRNITVPVSHAGCSLVHLAIKG